ncbi:hypothetical protein FGB62_240g00 [Gracilaria domingensis]|nr:hypothetical protein FGB62_240g00 [Gracilaria domingensis]
MRVSSLTADLSTSWTALKADTDYWENRDYVLLMRASSFADHIIDEDILTKRQHEIVTDGASSGRQESHEVHEVSLDYTAKQVVQRVVDEAVAAHELIKLHPNVRMRYGGIAGTPPVVGKTNVGVNDTEGRAWDRNRGRWALYFRSGWVLWER